MQKKIEVEVRALLEDRKRVERNLMAKGARLVQRIHVTDHWYCDARAKNPTDASIDSSGYALRLREVRNAGERRKATSLECKTLVDRASHSFCNEYEVAIDSPLNGRKILESIGLKLFLTVEKERTLYQLRDIKFFFDSIKGIGEGLEVEMMVPRVAVERAYVAARRVLEEIGVKKRELLVKSLTRLAIERFSHF